MDMWYSVRHQSRWTQRVQQKLSHLGLDVFCPTFTVVISNTNTCKNAPKRMRLEPLFIGVLFVRFDSDNFDKSDILNVAGVYKNQSIKPVPDSFICATKRIIEKGELE